VAVCSLVYGKPPEKYGFLPTSTDLCVEGFSLNTTGKLTTQENVFTTIATTETVEANSTR